MNKNVEIRIKSKCSEEFRSFKLNSEFEAFNWNNFKFADKVYTDRGVYTVLSVEPNCIRLVED
jgi:hypothetical protein